MTEGSKRTVVLSGASGVVGTALEELFVAKGDKVVRLVRRSPKSENEARWDPEAGEIDRAAIAGADAFVHLSGENVGEGRWSPERKQSLIDSRVVTTSLLARTIAAMNPKPASFVCASAIGYYGFERDEPADESAPLGQGFLAELCEKWESAAEPARQAGVRTVSVRLGVVITKRGGALTKMLPVFKLGGGGPIGGGRQMMSWISLADTVRGFEFIVSTDTLSGPVNLVAPKPVDNRTFAKTLGAVLGRPAIVPVPRLAITAVFGEMGKETVLASQNVVPKKLLAAGFAFEHPTLEEALRSDLQS